MINEKPPHLFVLPNGSHLSYAFPRDKGNQYEWKRSWDMPLIRNWKAKSKNGQIRVGLWTSRSNQHVLAIDIDRLPAGYGSFDELRQYLTDYFGGRAIIASSYSGKAKAFVVVEFPRPIRCNRKLALRCLSRIVPETLGNVLDTNASALSITYTSQDIINKLSNLSTIKPYIYADLITINPIRLSCSLPEHSHDGDAHKNVIYSDSKSLGLERSPFPIWDGIFPPDLRKRLRIKNPVKETVFRKLLSINGLTTENGFSLPCTRLGTECETSHTNVSYWLRGWIKDGLLECIDETYNFCSQSSFANSKAKAKRYRFSGEALIFAESISRDWNTRFSAVTIPDYGSPIEDGKAHHELFLAACKFANTPEQFWQHTLSRPNIRKKDRLRLARYAIGYHCPSELNRNIRDYYPVTSG